jgi:hypothetical protein
MPPVEEVHNGMRDVPALADASSFPFGGVTPGRMRETVGICWVVALERRKPREQRLTRDLNPLT